MPKGNVMLTQFFVGALVFALPVSPRPVVPAGQLAAGTIISLAMKDMVTSRKNQVGGVVAAVINKDVKDATGRVVLPSGSTVQLKIVAFQPPMPHQDDARILLE